MQSAIDPLDEKILAALLSDSSTSTSRLARRFHVARSTVQARIEKLERSGVIAGYTIRLGAAHRAHQIRATVLLQVEPRMTAGVLQKLKAMPSVEVARTTTGRIDLILEVAAATTSDLDQALDRIGGINGVRSSESLIHLSTKIAPSG